MHHHVLITHPSLDKSQANLCCTRWLQGRNTVIVLSFLQEAGTTRQWGAGSGGRGGGSEGNLLQRVEVNVGLLVAEAEEQEELKICTPQENKRFSHSCKILNLWITVHEERLQPLQGSILNCFWVPHETDHFVRSKGGRVQMHPNCSRGLRRGQKFSYVR